MAIQDSMTATGSELKPGRQLTIPLRYPSGTGVALAGGIAVGVTWQYIPPYATWPLVVLGVVAMVCDTVNIAIRDRRRKA